MLHLQVALWREQSVLIGVVREMAPRRPASTFRLRLCLKRYLKWEEASAVVWEDHWHATGRSGTGG